MNRKTESGAGKSPSPHTLIADDRTGGRRHAGRFYLAASALLVGVFAAFIWMSQSYLGNVSQRAEEAATLPAATSAVLLPVEVAVAEVAVEPDTPSTVRQSSDAPASSATPTRTPTPITYLKNTEAVVGLGGATVWNADGSPALKLAQGALVSATQRSADGEWVFTVSEDGAAGWIAVDSLIIFDAVRLAPQDIVIIPITPTPGAPVTAQDEDQFEDTLEDPFLLAETLPTVTVLPGKPGKGFTQPDSDRQSTARIALEDSRLNVRAGPGSTYKVIAKALPEELYTLRAISDDGDWIQIGLPDVAGGFGWAAADYLETNADLKALPVSTSVSSAPAFAATSNADETGGSEPVPAPTSRPEPENSGLPPMRIGPPSLGGGKTSSAQNSVTGLTGKLVIQQEWGGSIYVYDLETGEMRLLTGGFDPSISPDGSQVTFTREGGENGVYAIDIEGGPVTLLFGGREHLRSPKFSPDGEFIVFERGDESIRCKNKPWRCRLSVPSPDGEFPEHEVQPSLARIRVDGSDYWDPMDLPYARVPDWNEGGIVYQSLSGLQIAQNEPNVDTVLVYFDILKQYEMDPDWQPGAGVIVFQQRESSHWEIFAVNPDGSDLHALTRPEFPLAESLPSNVSPAWSPDGKHIVFLSNRTEDNSAGDWGVWVMEADGTNQRRLPIELPLVYTYVSEQMLDWGPP